jgi:ferredoxin
MSGAEVIPMIGLRYIGGVTTLELDGAKCNGCRMCETVCPHGVLAVVDRRARIVDRDGCMECGACSMNCAEGAITLRPGVGCAAAIIKGWITRSEPSCDCG